MGERASGLTKLFATDRVQAWEVCLVLEETVIEFG